MPDPSTPVLHESVQNVDKTAPYIVIRDVSPADLAAIIDIDTEVSSLAKPAYWQDIMDLHQRQKQREFFLVAERDQQVIGFIIGEIRAWEFGSSPCGWVFAIGVTGTQRLAGIGARMLDTLCEHFRHAGVTKVRTMTSRRQHEVLAFFRSQGMMAGPYQELEKDLD